MTCKRGPKAHVVSVVSLLITIFAILIALVAPAQLTGGGQPSAKPTVVPTPQDASPPLFLPAVAYDPGGLLADSVTVADVNGDGKPDLLVANQAQGVQNHGSVGVLLGNGDGTFQAAVTYDSGDDNALAVAVADVNGDGKPDLLVANLGTVVGSTVGVLLGKGDGTFQAVVSYGSGGNDASSVAVADINGDGKPDLVVTNCSPGCQTMGVVGVLLGNGNGTFQTAVNFDSGGPGAVSVAVADVNGDGKPDLVVANQCASSTNCMNGTSQSPSAYSFQYLESTRHIAALGDQFKMLQVRLTHRSSNRTVPIRLIHADQHAFNHVFCLLVKDVGFANVTAARLQVG